MSDVTVFTDPESEEAAVLINGKLTTCKDYEVEDVLARAGIIKTVEFEFYDEDGNYAAPEV
jgi:hypothetical protein